MAFILGLLFLDLGNDQAFERTGVVLYITMFCAVGVFNVVPILMGDREVMYRQTVNNMCEAPGWFFVFVFLSEDSA